MTVVPRGPDAIETWNCGCCFCLPFFFAPLFINGSVQTRKPGTNEFGGTTFKADGISGGSKIPPPCCASPELGGNQNFTRLVLGMPRGDAAERSPQNHGVRVCRDASEKN